MSNAAKHRKKAAEFEQLKQFDRAIASYVQAIEESEAEGEYVDVALYNKVGDLAIRQGRVPDAITYYERAVEHYATSGLFNNAIALCKKILRSAPGRANVYFTLGRISARKGLRGDATRNFLEYATRMQQEGRIEEGLRALAEVLDIMPELADVRMVVDELAARSGIALPRRRTPMRADRVPTPASSPVVREQKSQDLIFLDIDYGEPTRPAPAQSVKTPTPSLPFLAPVVTPVSVPAIADRQQPVAELESFAAAPEPAAEPLPLLETPIPDLEPVVAADPATVTAVPLEGLEANGEFVDQAATAPLDGFTPEEERLPADVVDSAVRPRDVTWLVPPEEAPGGTTVEDLAREDLLDATNDPRGGRAISTATAEDAPRIVPDAAIDDQPFEVESFAFEVVPELDDAIATGHTPAAPVILLELDDVEEQRSPTRPPFRLDPHDFILPGELPPLLLDDEAVAAGLSALPVDHSVTAAAAEPGLDGVGGVTAGALDIVIAVDEAGGVAGAEADSETERRDREALLGGLAADFTSAGPADAWTTPEAPWTGAERATDRVGNDHPAHRLAEPTGEEESAFEPRPMSATPALPIAAVAEAAASVASSRRDSLRAAVARLPKSWLLRRRLAEALFEAGEREAALHELETAQTGLVNDGEFVAASDIADELVQVSPDRVGYHQKRVELAVRTADRQRLRLGYLDLADALVRLGEEGRARAVYARVLEIDPYDDRARAALGAAAPPPPPPPPAATRADDNYVDLAEWLRDEDKPANTRMRMREPAISGDEQADFDALLQHFKDGVSRSLGEDDFESHYDLGVAYKEMGLLDDAIAEFQKALRSRTHRLPAYEALGQCFVEQERFQVAATVLSRALYEPGLDDGQRVGVLYLLAHSCEALQRKEEARSYFQRVYATDINFRDVAARLAALEQASR